MPRPGTVFFGGLPTSFDRRDIERLVAGYGPYDDIDFKPRPHFNFAFVDFSDRRDAEYAIKDLHGTYIQPGYKITVEFSQGRGYKPRDPPYRRYRSRTPPRSQRGYDRRRSPPRGYSPYGHGSSRSPAPRHDRRYRSTERRSRSLGSRGGSRTPPRRSRRSYSGGRSPSRTPRATSGSRGRWRKSETPPRRRGTVGRSRRSPGRSPTPGTPRRRRVSMSPPGASSPALRARSGSPGPALLRPEGVSASPPPRHGRSAGPLSPRRTTRSAGQSADKMDIAPAGPSPVGNSQNSLNGYNGQTADRESEAEDGHQ